MLNNASNNTTSPDIVLLTPTLDGGIGRFISLLARGMKEAGLSVHVWTIAGGMHEDESGRWAHIEHIQVSRAYKLIQPLMHMIRFHRPQAILSNSFHINCIAIIARIFARTKTKLYITEHTSLGAGLHTLSIGKRIFAKMSIRLLYKKANGIIAVSKGVAEDIATYSGITKKHITVIYNPVITPDLFIKSKEPIEHPFFKTNEPVLLAVGRLSIEKDYLTLIRAFNHANKIIPMRLLVIGDGPERIRIQETIDSLGIKDRVSLLGTISNPYPYFIKSNLYILSSIREGLPTTLIEALALGIPIISTDIHSGPAEILQNGTYGTLIPPQNQKALSDAIIESLQSEHLEVPENATAKYRIQNATDAYIQTLSLKRS